MRPARHASDGRPRRHYIGHFEGIELALTTLAEGGDEVSIDADLSALHGKLAKIGARPVFYRLDPSRGWQPDIEHLRSLVNPKTRALVVIDPNNPTGATYDAETDKALLEIADQHNIPLLADEVRGPGTTVPSARSRVTTPMHR